MKNFRGIVGGLAMLIGAGAIATAPLVGRALTKQPTSISEEDRLAAKADLFEERAIKAEINAEMAKRLAPFELRTAARRELWKKKYGLADTDRINLETGEIMRAPAPGSPGLQKKEQVKLPRTAEPQQPTAPKPSVTVKASK